MKIFVTGMSPAQVGSHRRRVSYMSTLHDAIVPALKRLGHEVDYRGLRNPADAPDFSQYDLAVVGIMPLTSFVTSIHVAALEPLVSGLPCLLCFEDWRVIDIMHAATRAEKLGEDFFLRELNGTPYYRSDGDQIRQRAARYTTAAIALGGDWPREWRGLMPLHRFGNHAEAFRKFSPAALHKIASFDPSSWMREPVSHPEPEDRARRWRFATVQDQSKWLEAQGFSWPVDVYGPRGAEGVLADERAVLEKYVQAWGVLAPPYYHAGSGWWRMRTVQAVDAGNVLYLDPRDQVVYPKPYSVNLEALESATTGQLSNIARNQRDALLDAIPTADDELVRLDKILRLTADLGSVAEFIASPAPSDLLTEEWSIGDGYAPVVVGSDWTPSPSPEPSVGRSQSRPPKTRDPRVRKTREPRVPRPPKTPPQIALRPGGWDPQVYHEVVARRVYEKFVTPRADDVWLDAGAHVGAFTWSVAGRVARVIAVEPSPANVDLLLENTRGLENVEIIPAALVPNGATTATLYLNGGGNLGTHTLRPTRGRETIEVPATSIGDVLARGVTAVKLDVEGAERELLRPILASPTVRALVCEWHMHGHDALDQLNAARRLLEARFDHVELRPDPPGKSWAVMLHCWDDDHDE